MGTRRLTIPIHDLTCSGDGEAQTIERALVCTAGVLHAYVNPLTEMAYVEYDASLACPDRLAAAVERAGFHPGEPLFR
ncbi:MAG: heavy-metal-associated domain-containing protein [Chloroflexi bacterium]|nr:heavy-metal-associated domain-containing protein [Chloroflexota bacterium]